MRIGINASFLRKPGTGIGQVTLHFLKTLAASEGGGQHEYILYVEEDVDISFLPSNFTKRVFLPFWKRDDVPRKWLWEKYALPKKVTEDNVKTFLSLYQSATVFSESVKHTMVVHDIIPRIFPQYQGNLRQKMHWQSIERAIMKTDQIVAVSEATRNDLVEFGVERKKIVLAYPDTDPLFSREPSLEENKRVLEKYSLEQGYIYHGGGFEVRKNAANLLRAYALLVEKDRNKMLHIALPPLVVSGKIFPKGNALATSVEELVIELGLEGRVHFLGFVPEEDLPPLYKNALFFAYPSLYEGFGLPVLEALKMGTPVLVSENSSLPEVAGNAGLYIDPTNIDSIASGIERLLSDASLRQTLREQGNEQSQKFHWRGFVEIVLRSIENK